MDSDGHVHNAVHLRYLEETRINVFRERGGLAGACVVAQMDIDYVKPLRYRPDPVRVETWLSKLGGSSFTLVQEIRDEDVLYSTATCTLVAFDTVNQRSRPLQDEERAMLEELSA
ncbi:acyl-CoA thioesterase [Nocardia sp. NPDC057668]